MTPVAAVASRWPNRWISGLAAVAASGELVADKLPRTPSRLEPLPLAGRVLLGALSGGLYARSRGSQVVVPALIAAGAAVATSYGGAIWRDRASRRDLGVPAALIEDAAAVVLATGAAR
jgi:uncharacterized membrane protein